MIVRALSFLAVFVMFWNNSLRYNIVVIGAMMLLVPFIKNPFPMERRTVYLIIAVLAIFILMANMNIYHSDVNYKVYELGYQKKLYLTFVAFLILIFFFQDKKDLLYQTIDAVLWVVVSLWMMQFIVYYTTGQYIDLLEPVNGTPQRYHMYFLATGEGVAGGPIRPTSIYNEPGTYAMATLPLLILSYLKDRTIRKIHLLTLFSFFASLSFFAIIEASLFTFIVMLSKFEIKPTAKNVVLGLLFVIIIVALGIGLENYLELRSSRSGEFVGAEQRSDIFSYWLSGDSLNILMGQGFAQTQFSPATIDDSGLAFKLLYEYGIWSIPLFGLLFYLSWGLPAFFLVIVFLTKMSYTAYIFWFYMASLYLLHKQK